MLYPALVAHLVPGTIAALYWPRLPPLHGGGGVEPDVVVAANPQPGGPDELALGTPAPSGVLWHRTTVQFVARAAIGREMLAYATLADVGRKMLELRSGERVLPADLAVEPWASWVQLHGVPATAERLFFAETNNWPAFLEQDKTERVIYALDVTVSHREA